MISPRCIQVFAILALLSGCAGVGPSDAKRASPQLDFSGYERFVATKRLLESGETLGAANQRKLFSAPGYDLIIDNDREAEIVGQLIQFAFRPADSDARDAVLVDGGMKASVLTHLMGYRDRFEELDAWRRRLVDPADGGAWLEDAFRRASELLPDDLGPRSDPPKIQFVAFNPDGTATAEVVVVDLLVTLNMGEAKFRGFLAHELHHVYAERLSRVTAPNRADPSYFLFHALRQLQKEGIADQIDKRTILDATKRPQDDYGRRYFDAMRTTPSVLRSMDKKIVQFGAGPPNAGDIATQIFHLLPFAGHPNGGFMGTLIRRNLGTSALVESIGNPFEFVRAYNEAARREAGEALPFSDEAMRVLDDLERVGLRAP